MTRQQILMLEGPSLMCVEPSHYLQALFEVKKFAEILLHQQLWFFGEDIKCPTNNLLLNYGFKQVRPPKDISGCTNYIYRSGEVNMVLLGFGVFFSQDNDKGIYICLLYTSPSPRD